MARRLALAGTTIATVLAIVSVGSLAWSQGKWECPAGEKGKKGPASTPQSVAAGKKLVAEKACTACHGETGKGDGPGAAALNPKPANWTSAAVQTESDGCLFWKISTGRGAMPPWGQVIPDEKQRWQLVDYIRTLKGK